MESLVKFIFGANTTYELNAYTVVCMIAFIMLVYLLTAVVQAFSSWGGR